MNKKGLIVVVILLIIGAVYFFALPQQTIAPTQTSVTPSETTPAAVTPTTQATPSPDQGAAAVSNPNAPKGSAAECAKCDAYPGVQKAQCLVALNC